MRISDWSSDVCSSDLLIGGDGLLLGAECRVQDIRVGRRVSGMGGLLRAAAGEQQLGTGGQGGVAGGAKEGPSGQPDGGFGHFSLLLFCRSGQSFAGARSAEERRGGKVCSGTCSSRASPLHKKTTD